MPKKTRVLVIDDDVTLANLLCMLFVKDGLEAISAVNGQEGIRLARKHEPRRRRSTHGGRAFRVSVRCSQLKFALWSFGDCPYSWNYEILSDSRNLFDGPGAHHVKDSIRLSLRLLEG